MYEASFSPSIQRKLFFPLYAVCLAILIGSSAYPQNTTLGHEIPTKTISTNLTGFTVPFKIDNKNGNYIEVHLYISKDKGKTWNFSNKQDVDGNGFKFSSDGDGEYWFALKTLDRNRQLVPAGNIVQPELRIVVDTKKPKLDFSVESDAAGRVITSWKINDEFLEPKSLTLSHRGTAVGSVEQWIPVDYTPSPNINRQNFVDRVAWWPQTLSKRIAVRLEITDAAGNIVSDTRTISLRIVANHRRGSNSTTSQNRTGVSQPGWSASKTSKQGKPNNIICENGICRVANNDDKRPNTSAALPRSSNRAPVRRVGSPPEYMDPPAPDGQIAQAPAAASHIKKSKNNKDDAASSIVWESKSSNRSRQSQAQNASTLNQNNFSRQQPEKIVMGTSRRLENIPVVRRKAEQQDRPYLNQVVTESTSEQNDDMVISQSTAYGRGKPISNMPPHHNEPRQTPTREFDSAFANSQATMPNETVTQQKSSRRQSQLISHANRQFTPPTRDNTKQKLNINTRRFNLNYDIRAIDPSGVGRVILWATENGGATWKSWASDPDNTTPFPVEVTSEGVFGFRVVINSRDGLTGKPPVSGDTPDVWVHVDLTKPNVALTSAPYGSGRDVGKLVLHWEAHDQFLAERPIRLLYSPNPNGPWTTIEDRLRNTGSFAWKVPQQVPEQIFVRIEAKDEAKNVGIYQLTSPIDISGLVPRGRIYGVEPVR